MIEYTAEKPPGRLPVMAVKPPGNSPPLLKEAQIAKWLSAPLISFDGFLQYPLSKDSECWRKLPRETNGFSIFLQGKLEKTQFNEKFIFPDEINLCYSRRSLKSWQPFLATNKCRESVAYKLASLSVLLYCYYLYHTSNFIIPASSIPHCRSPPLLEFGLTKFYRNGGLPNGREKRIHN